MGRILSVLSVVAACALPAHAQKGEVRIGQKVMTKSRTPLRVGGRVVNDDATFRVYTVKQVEGNWLGLVSGGIAGWVPSGSVVPFDRAVDYYTRRIRKNPNSASDYLNRGLILHKIGETNAALADDNQAIRLDPGRASAYNNRGLVWYDKAEYGKALADYNDAIRLDPKFALAFNNRGRLWRVNMEYGKALADYNEAIRLNPKFALAFHNRGLIWGDQGEYVKALADYNEAVRLNPNSAGAFGSRAWLWATCPDEAVRDGKRAVESALRACALSGWKDANHLDTLAAAYAEAGEFDKAVHWEEKASALDADSGNQAGWRKRLALYRNKTPYHLGSRN